MRYLILILFLLFQTNCDSGGGSSSIQEIEGCLNDTACNYNPQATISAPDLCAYEIDCAGNCCISNTPSNNIIPECYINDCYDECGGSAVYDECGECVLGSTGLQYNQSCNIETDGCNIPLNSIGFVPQNNYDNNRGFILFNFSNTADTIRFTINNIDTDMFNQYSFVDGLLEDYNYEVNMCTQSSTCNLTNDGSFEMYNHDGLSISGCGILSYIDNYENDFNSNNDEVYIDEIVLINNTADNLNITYFDTCENLSYDCQGICGGNAYIDQCSDCVEGLTGGADCLEGYVDCYGNIGIDADPNVTFDCNNVCGGNATEDCLGICNGNTTEDCLGNCGGSAIYDECGICDGLGILEGTCDCSGNILDCNNVCGGEAVTDCAGVCNGVSTLDYCGVCDGDNSTCSTETVDITYETDENIYGFQFNVDGVQLVSASGGDASINNFTVQNAGSTVLGFSFSGTYIPAGSGVLTTLEFLGSVNNLCINDLVVSGPAGSNIIANINNCLNIYNECVDLDEDDICDNVDSCIGHEDCLGVCNGDATVDCLGVCNGAAVEDCAGVCDGSSMLDCLGICGGFALEDDCGVCNGDDTSCASSCESDVCLSISNGMLLYESSQNITGFQFNHNNCASQAFGGDAANSGFSISTSITVVLGFSFSGDYIPSGSGVLLESVNCSNISGLVFSGPNGSTLSSEFNE